MSSEDSVKPNESKDMRKTRSTILRSRSINGELFEYFGWVYHVGVNSIGQEFCHFRYLFIRGTYVEMYKRDPHEKPGTKPIRRGVIGPTLLVEDIGRRKVSHGDVYVLRFYNRLDQTKKGEWFSKNSSFDCCKIACTTADDAQKWMEAFDHAKQQVEYEVTKGRSVRDRLSMEDQYVVSIFFFSRK
ncbi:UNVERIFIED_CONTAM: hypothetical protein Scaly_0584300 [Sesamum calycinum]|uniref:PH domain-containing protein n=1 Tax=Sesamum calycinum TaxID=2727403 RepID=A0AAW2RRW3_9LAMI